MSIWPSTSPSATGPPACPTTRHCYCPRRGTSGYSGASTNPPEARTYNPYGTTTEQPVVDNSAGNYDYGWLGEKQRGLEHETGLTATIEMGARQYDPTLGRFLETDPVEGGSANNYDYANGDPINQRDFTGTKSHTYYGRWKTFPWYVNTVGSLMVGCSTVVACISVNAYRRKKTVYVPVGTRRKPKWKVREYEEQKVVQVTCGNTIPTPWGSIGYKGCHTSTVLRQTLYKKKYYRKSRP